VDGETPTVEESNGGLRWKHPDQHYFSRQKQKNPETKQTRGGRKEKTVKGTDKTSYSITLGETRFILDGGEKGLPLDPRDFALMGGGLPQKGGGKSKSKKKGECKNHFTRGVRLKQEVNTKQSDS